MPSLLESLSQLLPNDAAAQIGKVVGLSPDLVNKGLRVVAPVVTGALAQKAASPGGLESLLGMLPSGSGTTGFDFGDVLGMLKPGAQKNLLSNLFGPGTGAIGATLNKRLGFDASRLIPVVAPLVLGMISKVMHSGELDKAGLAQFLNAEQNSYFEKNPADAALVHEALDAGREAAAVKDRYTSDEWEKVRLGPVAAAQVVMLASPSGLAGSVKEISSVLDALNAGRENAAAIPTGLLNVAFGDEVSKDEFMVVAKNRTPAAVLDMVRGAVATVAVKNPADVASYKGLLLDTARRAAEAAKEGGLLGIGGTRISSEEQAALDQIRNALNT